MRLSRWGWSRYETQSALDREAQVLSARVQIAPPRSDAEIIVVNSGTPVNAALLDGAPSAQLCITNTSGYEHLDMALLRGRGIRAARLPMARRDPVVESSLWGMIHGLRRHEELLSGAARGEWLRPSLPTMGIQSLAGARVVLVGLGIIGLRMAKVLGFLGAEVVGVDPYVQVAGLEQCTLDQAVGSADILSLHCSLRAGDEALIGAPLLQKCKRGMILVNTARGALVDWEVATKALTDGRLSALVADVFPEEPWPRMKGGPGVVLTPHSAGYHDQLSERLSEELLATVECFLEDRALPHPVC